MTHTTIDYSNESNQSTADAKAIADIKDYIGTGKFNQLTTEFRALGVETLSVDQLAYYLMLAGISGYPVEAWHRFIFPSISTPADAHADSFDAWADAQISLMPEQEEAKATDEVANLELDRLALEDVKANADFGRNYGQSQWPIDALRPTIPLRGESKADAELLFARLTTSSALNIVTRGDFAELKRVNGNWYVIIHAGNLRGTIEDLAEHGFIL